MIAKAPRGASIRGRVDLLRGAAAQSLVELVHRRYVGAGAEAIAAVAAFLNSDDAALRLHPDVAFTWDERPSDAARVLRESGAALPLLPTEPRT